MRLLALPSSTLVKYASLKRFEIYHVDAACPKSVPIVRLQSMVDLAGLYRVWNPKFNSYSVFGQDHVAKVLLSWNVADGHDAVGDAMKSIALFKLYQRLKPDEKGWSEALARCLVLLQPESF